MTVPIIDLFAGPGGLGEGFSRSSQAQFEIAVSIEKDPMASQTLRLRAAHRALRRMNPDNNTWKLWDEIVEKAPWNELFEKLASAGNEHLRAACEHAQGEVWNFEMSPLNREQVSSEIRKRLSPYLKDGGQLPDNLVLIGGPPCQAYSHVGRARNRGKTEDRQGEDHRHFRYLE